MRPGFRLYSIGFYEKNKKARIYCRAQKNQGTIRNLKNKKLRASLAEFFVLTYSLYQKAGSK